MNIFDDRLDMKFRLNTFKGKKNVKTGVPKNSEITRRRKRESHKNVITKKKLKNQNQF